MSRTIRVISQAVVFLLLASTPALAWDHHHGWHYYRPRVVIGVGPFWWGPPYAPWGYYPPYVAAYPPPVVVVQPQPAEVPPVYVEREDAPPPAAQEQSAEPGPQDGGAYWYYCPSAREYFPKVERCPEQWVKVRATPE
jgi:hypothetical protein